MKRDEAKRLVEQTFSQSYSEEQFQLFVRNLLPGLEAPSSRTTAGGQLPKAFQDDVTSITRLGKYTAPEGDVLDVVAVKLRNPASLDRARTGQRNLLAHYLVTRNKDAALVAFHAEDFSDWRFSFVKLAFQTEVTEAGTVKVEKRFTPARRFSFLVGANEPNHTAQQQLTPLLERAAPLTLAEIEAAFNIESITKEFFDRYKELFLTIKDELDDQVAKVAGVRKEFERREIETANFAKKLLGQIVFLYFIQKKGWLGVEVGAEWGSGNKDFLRGLFKGRGRKNYFKDILEPFFYEALALERPGDEYPALGCKAPFLNGGLFEPLNNYDWENTPLRLSDSVFEEVFKVFNLYNFTVREDEPLEREVAVDPEMLGKVFENLLEVKDRKSKGAFYTPREIVHYMCQESLIHYLDASVNTEGERVPKTDLDLLVRKGETSLENDALKEQGELISKGYILPESVRQHADAIDAALAEVRICDPAIGSGAFPVGMMTEIVRARTALTSHTSKEQKRTTYDFKWNCIENSLYGVDIDAGAVEIAKLRLWLSLVVDEESYDQIRPLPNLDYRIVCGNSLLGYPYPRRGLEEFERLKQEFFKETRPKEKLKLRDQLNAVLEDLFRITPKSLGYQVTMDFKINFSEVFRERGGFEIVIGNPPYVSTKDVEATDKKGLIAEYGFADDLYSHFYFRAFQIASPGAVVSYITSKTFFTIQTKENLRRLLLSKRILEIYDTGMPFDAMVDTAVIIAINEDMSEAYALKFLDGRKNLLDPDVYRIDISLYRNASRAVVFVPHNRNLKIYERLNEPAKALIAEWWKRIESSKQIATNQKVLEKYRMQLTPGDISLLGLLTEGGVGLQTSNNGRFVGVREGLKEAENIRKSRPNKLFEAIQTHNIQSLEFIGTIDAAKEHLNRLPESEVIALFDSLKQQYGRDIFGQGYLFRIISDDQIADVEKLSPEEKGAGIDARKSHYVPYDKGDKDGNRWYLETPFVLDWSKESVEFLTHNSGKKEVGMPVVRNPQFYFREGFCWTDVNSTYLKSRLKVKGVYDVLSMSLFSMYPKLPDWYFVCIINSKLASEFVQDFINSTSHFQINDARQLPIIIPNENQLKEFKRLFDRAYAIQESKFSNRISPASAEKELQELQKEMDALVLTLYGLEDLEMSGIAEMTRRD